MLPLTKLGPVSVPGQVIVDSLRESLDTDVKPDLNFGSFATTRVDEHMRQIMEMASIRNLACRHEYPTLDRLHQRCLSIIADLWEAEDPQHPTGSAVSGSSEALFLAINALKQNFLSKQVSSDEPLNLVVGAHVHVSVLKAAAFCGLEVRTAAIRDVSPYVMDTASLDKLLDHHTVGVVAVLGNTYTGHFDKISDIANALARFEQNTGLYIPIHVDGASGGFVAPFMDLDDAWNFQNRRVISINASGHKFGLAPLTVGWILWRNSEAVPYESRYKSSYLAGESESFTLSYSLPAQGVMGQYYVFSRRGREGFITSTNLTLKTAQTFSLELRQISSYRVRGTVFPKEEIEETTHQMAMLPVVIFDLSPELRNRYPLADEEYISQLLMQQGISVPCTTLPTKSNEKVLRVVVRPGTTDRTLRTLLDKLRLVAFMVGSLTTECGKNCLTV